MNNFKKHIVLFCALIFMLPASLCIAQNTITQDTTSVTVTYFKDNINERYADSDFNYNINDTGGVNLIQDLLRKFFRWLGDIFGFEIDWIDYQTLEYIVYGLLALGAIYLLIKFLLQAPMSTIFKTEEQTIENFSYVEENINEIDFENLITNALNEQNYRLATRYLYLKSLKNLTRKNIIDWHYDKTNTDYFNEITDDTIKKLFKRISYIYDYVWYGEFSINQDVFGKNQDDFNKLNKAING